MSTVINIRAIEKELLDYLEKYDRLNEQADELKQSGAMRVAVFGKYNHGKSSLLNALAGQGTELFKVADIRETTTIKKFEAQGVCWVDTPGLDADVSGQDDAVAMQAMVEHADVVLLVHGLETGELDAKETELFNQLVKEHSHTHCFMLVLNQIDSLETAQIEQVEQRIAQQISGLPVFKVSARRYLQGMAKNKSVLVNKSGVNELLQGVFKQRKVIDSLHQGRLNSIQKMRAKVDKNYQHSLQKLQCAVEEAWQAVSKFISTVEADAESTAAKIKVNNQQYR